MLPLVRTFWHHLMGATCLGSTCGSVLVLGDKALMWEWLLWGGAGVSLRVWWSHRGHGGAEIHPQLKDTPCQSMRMPEGGCAPMGSPCWSRGRVWEVQLLRRKEQQRQCVRNSPQPLSLSPCTTWKEEAENHEGNWAWEEKRGGGESDLRFGFISHCPTLIWLVIN